MSEPDDDDPRSLAERDKHGPSCADAPHTRRALAPERAKRSGLSPGWLVIPVMLAVPIGLGAILWTAGGPAGVDLPDEPSDDLEVPGCTCELDTGHAVRLYVRVTRHDDPPGGPERWTLAWTARVRDRVIALGGQAPGYTFDDPNPQFAMSCVGPDKIAFAAGRWITLYSVHEERVLWDREHERAYLRPGHRGAACLPTSSLRASVIDLRLTHGKPVTPFRTYDGRALDRDGGVLAH